MYMNGSGIGQWADIISAVVPALAKVGTSVYGAKVTKDIIKKQEKSAIQQAQLALKAQQAALAAQMAQEKRAADAEKSFFEKYGLYIGIGVAAVGIPVAVLLAMPKAKEKKSK